MIGNEIAAASPIEEKLKEIVTLREKDLELQQILYSEQRISDVTSARIALARARIDLARERKDHEAVVDQLEAIVAIRKLSFETARIREEMSTGSAVEAKVELLKAEVDLERARQEKE
ncbi:MAG: hypothetical protein MI807_21250 [Verrucomicrobiales bacterium]|nr:hypothetical protein [Verrucomicrobiales bacterium]